MATSQSSKKRFYCGHCNDYLCKTVYFQHKRLHFNKDTNEWLKEARVFQTNSTSRLPFCPSPQATNTQQPLASMVTSAAECQQSDSSAEPQTDSDSRPCDDDEVYIIMIFN